MMRKPVRSNTWACMAPICLLVAAYACGSSSENGASAPQPGGSSCANPSQCVSGVCNAGVCVGNGIGAPSGTSCSTWNECASGQCANGTCSAGTSLADGKSCASSSECASLVCSQGVCGNRSDAGTDAGAGGHGSGAGGGATTGTDGGGGAPSSTASGGVTAAGAAAGAAGLGSGTLSGSGVKFTGLGAGYRPLTPGCGPDTADQCNGNCEAQGANPSAEVIRPPALLCFGSTMDPTPDDPAAVIEQVIETLNGQSYVHIRITFDPAYVDMTYGVNTNSGWGTRIHKWSDLTGSDHTELRLTDGAGSTVMQFKVDLISQDATAPSGFGTLGVTGGDGKVIVGSASSVLAVATSLDRNLNGCGYTDSTACGADGGMGDCTVNSPATDDNYAPNPATPNWSYLQVYEVWLDLAAFGTTGFGQAYITYTHASPSKVGQTLTVEPAPCPPDWGDTPYTPDAGIPPDGGDTCAPNFQIYISTEGSSICTPIPFANYPNMAACPAGYQLDTASEGQYCLQIPG